MGKEKPRENPGVEVISSTFETLDFYYNSNLMPCANGKLSE